MHGTLQGDKGREGNGADFGECRHSVLRKYGQVGGALKLSRSPLISKMGVMYEIHEAPYNVNCHLFAER